MPVIPIPIPITQSPLLDTGTSTGAINIADSVGSRQTSSKNKKHSASSTFKPRSIDALPFLHRSGHVLRHAQSTPSDSEEDDLSTIDITTPLGEVRLLI
jgi:hypothetical protein